MSETPGSEKAAKTAGLLTFIAGNIASFSAIGLVATVVGSTIFTNAYLSIFDWRLIWILDYSDILKLGLVALAVLSGLFVFLAGLLFHSVELSLLEEGGKRRRRRFFVLLSIAGIAIFLVVQWLFGPIPLSLVTTMIASWSVLVVLCITVTRLLTQRDTVDASALIMLAALVVATVTGFGVALGSFTKHFPNWLHYDVFLKGGNMTDVRLVLFTSHHTALYDGDKVIVVPTADIVKIVAHPVAAQK